MEASEIFIHVHGVLKKYKKHEIIASILQWGALSSETLDFSLTKNKLIRQVCENSEKLKIPFNDIWTLDLICLINSLNKKVWHLQKLINATFLEEIEYKAKQFESLMQHSLSNLGTYQVAVVENHYSLWGSIHTPNSLKCLYFIHFPFSDAVLLTEEKSKKAHHTCVAFKDIFNCENIVNGSLHSSCPRSIAEVYLHSLNKNYTYDQGYYKPRERKSVIHSVDSDIKQSSFLIQHEDDEKRRREIDKNEKSFGKTVPPSFQNINIHSKTKIDSETIELDINFSGPNVLEGLHSLNDANLSTPSIPKFLTQVRNSNNIKITQN